MAIKKTIFFSLFVLLSMSNYGQTFTRSELPTELIAPWEIVYGSDGFLWLSESEGKVLRVNPSTGEKMVIYKASDYFEGSSLESTEICGLAIGRGWSIRTFDR